MTTIYIENYKYSGFHHIPSSCELKVWPQSNLVIASHRNFTGTSPINRAEHLAGRVSKDFNLKLKRLLMIIHVPSEQSFHNSESFSSLKFFMTWSRVGIKVDDVDFLDIELNEVLKIVSGRAKMKPRHQLRYTW